jgi:hypothetical protein
MQIEQCSDRATRSATIWTCHGSFTGDDGSRIAHITLTVRQDATPTDPFVVMVASSTATRAYLPGGQGYFDDVLLGGLVIGAACLFLYWPFACRRRRRHATAGLTPGV